MLGRARTASRLAWVIWGISVVAASISIPLDLAKPRKEADVGWYVFLLAAVLLYGTVGALITSRQPGNRVGWIFAGVAFIGALGNLGGAYAMLAEDLDLPLVGVAAWIGHVGFVAMLGPLAFLFLLFPTGRPPSRRWTWLLRVMQVAYAITVILFALTPGPIRSGFSDLDSRVQNPLGLPATWVGPISTLTVTAGLVVFVGALVSVASLIQRLRRASASERQQVRWLAFLTAFAGVHLVVSLALEAIGVIPREGAIPNVNFFVLLSLIFVGVPVTCAVAILRHGLWDLEIVIRKTVQYAVLFVATIAVVGLLLVLLPLLVVGLDRDIVPGIGVGIAVAVIVALLRVPAGRIANRIVYGRRATPYEVLSEFAERISETFSTEDVLPRMAQLLGEATGARVARVWLRIGAVMRVEAAWPSDVADRPDVTTRGDEPPSFDDDRAFEVRHQGELLGALTVTEAADDPISPSKEKLAKNMAAQAGLVLRNVRLIEELRESRRRIVAAQDARAKKLERDIHDGAQQQLVALAVKQRIASSLVGKDDERLRTLLEELQSQTNEALDDLRDLARGIYPPLLADRGLAAALESQIRKATIPVEIDSDGIGRYPPETESAVYFSCLEALQNVAKYADASTATIRLAQTDGLLTFEVVDDGHGFDPNASSYGTGLQGIADRLAALGGTLDVRSAPGEGTTVAGRLPVEAS